MPSGSFAGLRVLQLPQPGPLPAVSLSTLAGPPKDRGLLPKDHAHA